MGGAVCVKTCPRLQEKGYKVAGVAVLDVVEGVELLSSKDPTNTFPKRLGSGRVTHYDKPTRLSARWVHLFRTGDPVAVRLLL